MTTKSKTFSVMLSEEAMNLIKAEALKDDRSARSWLDRFIRATLPIPPQPQTPHTALPATSQSTNKAVAQIVDPNTTPTQPTPAPARKEPPPTIHATADDDPDLIFAQLIADCND